MFPFPRRLLQRPRPTILEGAVEDTPEDRAERIRTIIRAELSQTSVDGKPITHRKLFSLMLPAESGKKETIRRLREIGARQSSKVGKKVWTLDSK